MHVPASLRRPLPVALLLMAAAQALFTWRLTIPHRLVFDEVHYVPAARTLLALAGHTNIEHPLLGKTLIALGILLFGDGPAGWRALSTLAGRIVIHSPTLSRSRGPNPHDSPSFSTRCSHCAGNSRR